MIMIRKKLGKNCYYLINALFIIIIFTACLWDVGSLERIRVVDDGFCYWGIAAVLSGYDWTDLMATSAYYSYGYSLILIPLFWLNRLGLSMTLLYRLAIVMNAAFLGGCYFMTLYMLKELADDIPDELKQIISLFVTLYIGNTAQMGLAWTETFLCFMFWCVVVLIYRVMKKPGYLNILLLAAAAAELFAIHMRSIGVVAALCMVIFFFFISRFKETDKKYIIYTLGVSLAFLCLTLLLKSYVSNHIYMGNVADSINNVQANVSRFGKFLSVRGILDIALSYIGKLYYISTATFLLGIIGLFTGVFRLISTFIRKDGKRNKWQLKEWMILFVMLSFLAEVAIEAIFKIAPFFRTIETRILDDTIVFGRYADFVVGPMMMLGVWAVYKLCDHYYEVISGALASIAFTAVVQFLFDIVSFRRGTDSVGFRFASTPWLAALVDNHKADFAYYVMMIGLAALIILCLIRLLLPAGWKIFGSMLLLITCVWTVIGVSGGMEYTLSKAEKEKSVDTMAAIVETTGSEVPIYLIGSSNTEIKILQWLIADRSIYRYEPEDLDNIDTANAVILANSAETETVAALSERMDLLYDSGNISVFGTPGDSHYDGLSAKSQEMAHAADPTIHDVSLSRIATECSYTKMNGSLYYNYKGTDGGYMTESMGVSLEDGIYEFTVDMRVKECAAGTEIGYIEAGCSNGGIQNVTALTADDFINKSRQKVKARVEIKDWAEPVIGIYTYGNSAIRIYGISYKKIDGCITLASEEIKDIAAAIENPDKDKIYYVDSDNSGMTGFPEWEYGSLRYISGKLSEYKTYRENAYYIVEKTDEAVLASYTGSMNLITETENYALLTLP